MVWGRRADPQLLAAIPEDAGPRAMAFRGGAAHFIRAPGSLRFLSEGDCIGVLLEPLSGLTVAFGDDPAKRLDAQKGSIVVQPAGLESQSTWSGQAENIIVAISPESMRELAASEFDRLDFQLRPTMPTLDLTALQIASIVKTALNTPGISSELHLDSLITLLGIHMLRNYSNTLVRSTAAKPGLSAMQANRVKEYMHEHLTRNVTISELAGICGLSPSHFISSFAKTFGVPPHRYLVERRIELAQQLLIETDADISEVAFLSGFSSQSHLTNSMKKYRNITPQRFRLAMKQRRRRSNG